MAGLLTVFLGLSVLLAPFGGTLSRRLDFLGLPSRAASAALVCFLGLDSAVSVFIGELGSRVDFLGLASTVAAFVKRPDFRGLASAVMSVLFLVLF